MQIIDRRKANKKFSTNPSLIETVYADVSIPFSYVTSTIYKQDVRITPQYPESIIRIEVRRKKRLPNALKIVDPSKGFIGIFTIYIYFFSFVFCQTSNIFSSFFLRHYFTPTKGSFFFLPLFAFEKREKKK